MKKLIIMLISVISMYSASGQDTPLIEQKVTNNKMEKEDQKKEDKAYKQKYTDQYIKDASIVAESWLNDINNKQYKNAFKMLSSEVKLRYNQENWISLIQDLMLEFGGLESRKVTEKKFKSEVEGMEDGFYVFIDYKVSYLNTINHNEQILLKQNDKSKWKIVDYNYEFNEK